MRTTDEDDPAAISSGPGGNVIRFPARPQNTPTPSADQPPTGPLTDSQRAFLASLSRWPLTLNAGQRSMLNWIARS